MISELRDQLGLPSDLFMAAVVSSSVDQLGLRDQVVGLPLIQQAQQCLAVLGSPLASDRGDGMKSKSPPSSSPSGAGLPSISSRHRPKQAEAEAVVVGEVCNPELDALKKQLALEKERNALLAERERLEKEKAQRLEREAEAQRRLQAERERRERAERERLERAERERLDRLEREKARWLEREAEVRRRQKQEDEERMAIIERKKVATTDKALTVGGTIGFFCGGPVGMAIGMHVGDKWASKKIKERYPHPVA